MSRWRICRSAASARPAWAPITAIDGFRTFSHAKAVFQQTGRDLTAMLRPPYGEGIRKMLAGSIKA